MNYNKTQKRLRDLIISLLPRINLGDISSFQILLPPESEQTRISNLLKSADKAINKEEQFKNKLLSIKQGLMDDLLTGKVRVNHLIENDN